MSDGDWCVRRTICAPRFASSMTAAAPIPDVPPVTITTFPCIFLSERFVAPALYHFTAARKSRHGVTLTTVHISGSQEGSETPPHKTLATKSTGILWEVC